MIAHGLRIEKFKCLEIIRNKLSPRLGCGLVLCQIPKFHMSTVLEKIMKVYKIENVYADKVAQGFLQTDNTIKQFYTNTIASIPIEDNFRLIFGNTSLMMLIDYNQESIWFIGEVDRRLAFINYYRDIVPVIFKEFGLVITGSYGRLLPVGWQNLYDVIDREFINTNSQVKTIEILSVLTDVRFRNSILSIGINLLNLSAPEEIRDKISEAFIK